MPAQSDKAVFTFATTHEAMAAEDILRGEGVPLEVVPPPRGLSAGCGLALRVSMEDAPRAHATLAREGAAFQALHRLDADRRVRERLVWDADAKVWHPQAGTDLNDTEGRSHLT